MEISAKRHPILHALLFLISFKSEPGWEVSMYVNVRLAQSGPLVSSLSMLFLHCQHLMVHSAWTPGGPTEGLTLGSALTSCLT